MCADRLGTLSKGERKKKTDRLANQVISTGLLDKKQRCESRVEGGALGTKTGRGRSSG